MEGGRVAKDFKVVLQNVGSTGVDVFGPAGQYIGVGGPAKSLNLAELGSKLKILSGAARDAGVGAKYYFEKGTPIGAIRIA